ncbi:ABC transporter C family protein [Tieghemostelium lacteum]|uniref:ABC transporter C family protein n=1 Tax=Tieghemostelium lacteum TaxID=361077 RepID=A0A151ZFT5_TIELA|nr:ABC transporter C family protein [Tieghemostelium lacteum]|eukprot:KYQ92779.1 ABC transporter C family protein [Tieghemostelium lacteum]
MSSHDEVDDQKSKIYKDYSNEECPKNNANFIQKLLFNWVNGLIWRGYKRPLQLTDIYRLPQKYHAKEAIRYDLNFSLKYPIVTYIYKNIILKSYVYLIVKIFSAILSVAIPFALKMFINYIQSDDKETYIGWIICISLFLGSLSLTFAIEHCYWLGILTSTKVKTSLVCMVFEKMFHLSNCSRRTFTLGKIMNLISVDVDAFSKFFWNDCIDIFVNPLKIIGLLIFLCITVGVSGLVGFGLMLVTLPLNIFLNDKLCEHYAESLKYSDDRLQSISELVNGIRFLKIYAWESIFMEKISRERQKQMQCLARRNVFLIFIETINQLLGGFVLFITFLVYILLGNEFTASVAFTSLMIFVSLRSALQTLPDAFQKALGLKEASIRLETFLNARELNPEAMGNIQETFGDIEIIAGEFSWGDSLNSPRRHSQSSISTVDSTVKTKSKLNKRRSIVHSKSQLGLFQEDSSLSSEHDFIQQININSGTTARDRKKKLAFKESNGHSLHFRDLFFKAPSGKLTIICGPVGSGKSSLISALLGEMTKIEGVMSAPKSVGYASQIPFLQTMSIRDNILFGLPMDKSYYKKVIEACALDIDLSSMPGRDLTEIGEKGISLSGGQKQRISLARALYARPQCFLLDDPLNAVDTHVQKHLFKFCIQGLMRDTTCILITHQLQFLPYADHIVVVESGKVTQGTYEQLLDLGIDFKNIVDRRTRGNTLLIPNNLPRPNLIPLSGATTPPIIISNNNNNNNNSIPSTPEINLNHSPNFLSQKEHQMIIPLPNSPVGRLIQTESVPTHSPAITSMKAGNKPPLLVRNEFSLMNLEIDSVIANEENEEELKKLATLITEESRETGIVTWSVYKKYLKTSKSIGVLICSVLFYLLAQLVFQGASYWLTVWTKDRIQPHPEGIDHNLFYILVYGGFMVLFSIIYPLTIYLLSQFTLASSRNLHKNLLQAVIDAPSRFFDQNSSGRILNRFSVDTSEIDILTLKLISNILYCGSSVIVSLGLMIYVNYYIAAPVFILSFAYYFLQKLFRCSVRELKRMESISRSPMYSFLAEAYSGLSVIRAYGHTNRFIAEFGHKLDHYQRICFYAFSTHRWIETRLDLFASVIVLCASVFSIYSSDMNPGLAGFIVTTSFSLTGNLSWTVRCFSEFEVRMNSVERVISYTEIPSEAEMATFKRRRIRPYNSLANIKPSTSTSSFSNLEGAIEVQEISKSRSGSIAIPSPDHKFEYGEVIFKNVVVRYSDTKAPVLKEISFHIQPLEKIGIVGRTGSGKSTIAMSLLRLVECSAGSIIIDGCPTSAMDLKCLRKQIGVIPQEPLLLSGTLRSNIDPFNEHSDEEIWNALEKVNLKEIIKSQPQSIDTIIHGNDDIFSQGQKQLLSLCRVLIKDFKIILMDEATSALDFTSDALIKRVVKDNFKNATLLTIAHRLDTIMDYNKILVLHNGKVMEFDTPHNLMSDPTSRFSKLLASQNVQK